MRRLYILVLLLQLSAAGQATCSRPLQVGYYEFGLHYQAGAGIDVDVVEELLRRVGCSAEPRYLSRALIWRAMQSGALDLTPSSLEVPERQAYADFIPYYQARNLAVLRPGAPLSAAAFRADRQRRFGVVRGFRHGEAWDAWIEQLRAQGRIVEASDAPMLAVLLERGRIDGFPALPTAVAPLLKDRGRALQDWPRRTWFAEQPAEIGQIALQRDRLPAGLREELARALLDMRRDGSLERIFARHLGNADEARAMLVPLP